jgi:cytidine deaminase
MARPELIIGLVGPVGARLGRTAALVRSELGRIGYTASEEISLGALLDQVITETRLPTLDGPYSDYIEQRQRAGGELRERTLRGDALAVLAIAEIARRRAMHLRDQSITESGRAPDSVGYVLRSLKHPREVQTLRRTYAERFVLIGVLLPRSARLDRLAERIANTDGSPQSEQGRGRALALAAIDEDENRELGQHMRDCFALADMFVDISDRVGAQRELARFFDALMGDPFVSPTRAEHAMFQAHAAGLRSVDLGRQVGAAIVNDTADVLAVGCNEVPAYGGGAYWTGDVPDGRDFAQGGDPNAKLRRVLMDEVRAALIRRKVLDEGSAPSESEFREALKDTRLDDLTEFGRVVHAEMHALLDAARRGVATQGATLYSTTFPCHNCAKHIVAAGITEVRYIAPYPKSLAEDLHPDSVVVEPRDDCPGRVRFQPFNGIAPAVYGPLFTKTGKRRSATGDPVSFDPRNAVPRLVRNEDEYLEREQILLVDFQAVVRARGVELHPAALAPPAG